jgi:hypothetical protein
MPTEIVAAAGRILRCQANFFSAAYSWPRNQRAREDLHVGHARYLPAALTFASNEPGT